jgi:endonuclease YncB( thermonuclease family)
MRGWIAVLGLVVVQAGADLSAQRPRELVNKRITGKVVSVIDGDTVDLLMPSKHVLRIRLHGIDAPERGEPFHTQARNFTRVLLFSREVEVLGKDADPYGRLVARVSVDGKDASASILGAGLGCTFHRYVIDRELDMALTRAREGHLGFWASGAQQPPCVARESRFVVRAR